MSAALEAIPRIGAVIGFGELASPDAEVARAACFEAANPIDRPAVCDGPKPGPLDVHGWARTGVGLSGRAITGIVPRRRASAEQDVPGEHVGPVIRPAGRFDALTAAEAFDALGEADAAVDAVLERLAALQHDVMHLADAVDTAERDRFAALIRAASC